ncbi:MAG: SDR family oxidoreductase [Myxococcota bacterium]
MKRYLITGVAGFIGSSLARALLSGGASVRGIDNFSTGRHENIADLKGLELIEGDIVDLDVAKKAVQGVDYILHQAAVPSVPRSIADPLNSNRANVTGTLCILDAARLEGNIKRVVYASSSSAYGDSPTLPKVETMATRPRSPYAVSKLAGEHYAQVYSAVYALPCVCLRYFNVFGPRQDPNSQYAAVIPKFITSALKGEAPPVFGDGKQSRDFTYIDNVIEANLKACEAPDVAGEVFNIACGTRIDLLTLIDQINEVLGTTVKPKLQQGRPGDVRDSLADISKAKKLLGYSAAIDSREGLRRTITWYKESAAR